MVSRYALRGPLAVLVALIALAGCDTDGVATEPQPEPELASADSAYAALLAGVGGVDGLAVLLRTASDAELATTFAGYGMAFEVVDRADAGESGTARGDGAARMQDVTTCPQRFPTSDRVKWFRLVGAGGSEDHYVDSRGRPATALKSLGPVTAAPRQTTCQTTVGNWATPAADYDGGHMIGSQLGGWGGRANLVPQHYNFNRGNWKRVEDALARCSRLGSGRVEVHVDVDYSDASTLTPSQFHADVKIGGVWKSADFVNTPGGGASGLSEATGMVSWLQGQGCY